MNDAIAIAVAIAVAIDIAVHIDIAVTVAFVIAVSTSACNLIGYITRHDVAGKYSLCKQSLWGVLLPLEVTEHLKAGFLTLQGWVYS